MSETTLERWKRLKPHFTCPRCDATSWNPSDIANLYCGRCHLFFAPHVDLREGAPRDPVGVRKARKKAIEAWLRPEPQNERVRSGSDDDTPGFQMPTFTAPDPPAPDPSPSSIDPGGGDSGGAGASGDY